MINIQRTLPYLFLISLCLNQDMIGEGSVSGDLPKLKIAIERDQNLINKENALNVQASSKVNDLDKYIKEVKEEDVALYNESYAQAPAKIKFMVYAAMKGDELGNYYKNILLTGPTGSGKTILAQAIAYKLQRKCIVIDAPSLLGHYRDQAVENIRKLFKDLSEYKEKPVLIIDEINILADGYTSEHADTKDTAAQLWTLLDQSKNDKDFFLIGTSNITKKMPHQLQSRFQGQIFTIDNHSHELYKRNIEFYLKKLNVTRDESCDDAYLMEFSKKIEKLSQRAIEVLIKNSIFLFFMENPHLPIKKITKKHLEQAYEDWIRESEKFCDFNDPIADEERRHQESLSQNKVQYEDNKETQLKLAKTNLLFQALVTAETAGGQGASKQTTVGALNESFGKIFPGNEPIATVISKWLQREYLAE